MNESPSEAVKLEVGKGAAARAIAVIARKARRGNKLPGVVWLGGYRSHMLGTKAQAIDAWCERKRREGISGTARSRAGLRRAWRCSRNTPGGRRSW
jgi:hypothetical protein